MKYLEQANLKDKVDSWLVRASGEEGTGFDCKEVGVPLWSHDMFWNQIMVMVAQPCEYTKN